MGKLGLEPCLNVYAILYYFFAKSCPIVRIFVEMINIHFYIHIISKKGIDIRKNHYYFKEIQYKVLHIVLCTQYRVLKGPCHEIFDLCFFSSKNFIWAP
jgi:hypothetical protein